VFDTAYAAAGGKPSPEQIARESMEYFRKLEAKLKL
jgi:hypothetical protein